MLTAAEMTFDSDSVYKLTLIIITPTVYYAIATSFCCKFTPARMPNAILWLNMSVEPPVTQIQAVGNHTMPFGPAPTVAHPVTLNQIGVSMVA